MLTEGQGKDIRNHLEKAQNPLFYYDNDTDGLCSYLLLRRFIDRGKGVAVRSFPDLDKGYARKAQELSADYVFVLDKPVISEEFAEEIHGLGLPLVWIDHHDVPGMEICEKYENFFCYNPAKNKGNMKSFEPVTYLSYKITGRKEDMWIAIAGCIADHYLPDFAEEFGKENSEYWGNDIKEPFDALYKTEIGKIAQAMNFGLKDSTTHIVHLQNYLISCKNPSEVFAEVSRNYNFRKKYKDVIGKYSSLLERAKNCVEGRLIFFEYGGDLSISSEVSNELSYYNPDKYVIVAYKKGGVSNLSIRGKNVKELLDKLLKRFENATGGGHENAVGARLMLEDLPKFKEEFRKLIQ
jgi:oligoribonuclease NrnB/cAMP/cGMP phosphodiesterase (DHH superfamily)